MATLHRRLECVIGNAIGGTFHNALRERKIQRQQDRHPMRMTTYQEHDQRSGRRRKIEKTMM